MRTVLLTLAFGALMGGAAQAGEAPDAIVTKATVTQASTTAAPKKELMVCSEEERDMASQVRDLGMPGFVTAKQVTEGKTWTGARCITPSEMRRLSLNMAKPAR